MIQSPCLHVTDTAVIGTLPGASRSLEFVKAALCVAAKAGTEATGMKAEATQVLHQFLENGREGSEWGYWGRDGEAKAEREGKGAGRPREKHDR